MAEALAIPQETNSPEQPKRTTAGPERLLLFLKDVRAETRKVITPSRSEVQNTTIVVLVTVFIFAAFFEAVDLVLGTGIDKIFSTLIKH